MPRDWSGVDWTKLSPAELRQRQRDKDKEAVLDPTFNAALAARARKRMARVDDLPPDFRQLVYDYGLEIIWEFWQYRLHDAVKVRRLIDRTFEAGHANNYLIGSYIQAGANSEKAARYLIGTVLADPFPNGQNRYALNRAPNRKANVLAEDEDDTGYFVVGDYPGLDSDERRP